MILARTLVACFALLGCAQPAAAPEPVAAPAAAPASGGDSRPVPAKGDTERTQGDAGEQWIGLLNPNPDCDPNAPLGPDGAPWEPCGDSAAPKTPIKKSK